MIEITSLAELNDVLADPTRLVILDCFASWCAPCLQIMRLLPRLEESVADIAVIAKVEADVTEVFDLYNVKSVPTFIFFKDGVEVERFVGVKPIRDIEAMAQMIHLKATI